MYKCQTWKNYSALVAKFNYILVNLMKITVIAWMNYVFVIQCINLKKREEK